MGWWMEWGINTSFPFLLIILDGAYSNDWAKRKTRGCDEKEEISREKDIYL
jgi:hypothetical protein